MDSGPSQYEEFLMSVERNEDQEPMWHLYSDEQRALYVAAVCDMDTIMEVQQEIARQIGKWGLQEHEPSLWNAILVEEVGEVSKAILETWFQGKDHTDNGSQYCKELIQVAAVAIAAVRAFRIIEANTEFSEAE